MSNGTLTTKSDSRLMVGNYIGSAGTFNLSGGEVSTGYFAVGGTKGRGTVNQTGGAIEVGKDGYIGQYSAPAKGETLAGESVYNLSGGTLTYEGNAQVGVYSNGRFEQSGGAVAETGGWTSVGRWVGASGVINMTGGTLGVCAETGAVYDWLCGIAGNFDVGPAGATLDTGAVDVYTDGPGLGGATTGTIVKRGSGSLNLGALPEATKIKVEEGTLGLRGATKSSQLVHRWSFNGTLEDSVGENDTAVYTPKGSPSSSAN